MNVKSLISATGSRAVVALMTTGALLTSALPATAEWRHARGDSANTSFARVDTQPATAPQMSRDVGPIAPGANPVIGPDGTVYIGNLNGQLHAFHAEGLERWTRQLNPEHGGIFTAPVVGHDGSIYVISTIHQAESPGRINESFLHKFTPSGSLVFTTPFPKSPYYPYTDGGATDAPPNLWRWNGTEAVMVPVMYKGANSRGISLLAFSTNYAAILGNEIVTTKEFEITGGPTAGTWECAAALGGLLGLASLHFCTLVAEMAYFERVTGVPLGATLPGVAIVPDSGSGVIVATDGHRARVAYSFSPQAGFGTNARSSSTRHTFTATPGVDGNGNARFGTAEGRLAINLGESSYSGLGEGGIYATPTRLHDGRLVVLSSDGRMTVFGTGWPTIRRESGGATTASAAASCTHVFVSTTDGLFTFNLNMGQVATANVPGGGLHAPVIGSGGRVYVVGQGTLYTFPGPPQGDVVVRTACDGFAPPAS